MPLGRDSVVVKYLFSIFTTLSPSLLQDDLPGQALLDVVFARLNLIETAYFGIRYIDQDNQTVSMMGDMGHSTRRGH